MGEVKLLSQNFFVSSLTVTWSFFKYYYYAEDSVALLVVVLQFYANYGLNFQVKYIAVTYLSLERGSSFAGEFLSVRRGIYHTIC